MKRVSISGLVAALVMMCSSLVMAADHHVEIKDFKFTPAVVNAVEGDRIIYTNSDGAPHTVIQAPDSELEFEESDTLNTGDQFVLDIEGPENVSAKCGIHKRMPGMEVVVASKAEVIINKIKSNLEELENELNKN